MNILNLLTSQITEPARIIQFAKDGKYEEAWIINLSQNRPVAEEVEHYIDEGNYKELIVEYIWKPDVNDSRYVLTVFHDNCLEKDKYKFISICLDCFYNKLEFQQLIDEIDQGIVGGPFLLRQPVQRVRLGVFNYWFSLGPIELWDKGDKLDKEVVTKHIKTRPDIERSKLNYQGLAFIYNFDRSLPGPYHVLKTPCCVRHNNEWVVDIDLVYNNMKLMLEEIKAK
ncbi:hypothetical protein KKB83_00890 [Patescibacteria group bacterium]|nr:hypothetical protein [Patescibacteria group bacterium]